MYLPATFNGTLPVEGSDAVDKLKDTRRAENSAPTGTL